MKQIFVLLLVLVLSQGCFAAEDSHPGLSGNWIAIQRGNSKDGTPYSTFEISLKLRGGAVTGSYCYVTRYGARIDCDLEAGNISGAINEKTGVAIVNFASSFGAVGGKATLSVSDDALKWTVVRQPEGGEYYGPNTAVLRKVGGRDREHSSPTPLGD
jgi:hypothetical protein